MTFLTGTWAISDDDIYTCPLSTKHVIEYSAYIFTTMPTSSPYVSLAKNAISFGCISNCTSGANVFVNSDSTFPTLVALVPHWITASHSA